MSKAKKEQAESAKREKMVRGRYPFTMSDVIDKLSIPPSALERFTKVFPPDYRSGKVRRYMVIPVIDDAAMIVGTGQDLEVVPLLVHANSTGADRKIRYIGRRADCLEIIKLTIREWWSLPRGKEIVTVCERNGFKLEGGK